MGVPTVKYYTDEAMTEEVDPIGAGTYYAYLTVTEGDNFNATEAPISLGSFTIAPMPIAAPTANSGLVSDWVYNEEDETWKAVRHELLDGFDANAMTWDSTGANKADLSVNADGKLVAFHAGTYSVTVTPDANHVWDEETPNRGAKEYSITIAPKPVTADYYPHTRIFKTYDGTTDYTGSFTCRIFSPDIYFTVTGGQFDSKNAGYRSFYTSGCTFAFDDAAFYESEYDCRRSDLIVTLPDFDDSGEGNANIFEVTIYKKALRAVLTGPSPRTMEYGAEIPFGFQLAEEEGNTFCLGDEAEFNRLRLYFMQVRNDTETVLPYPDSPGEYYLRVAFPEQVDANGKWTEEGNYNFYRPADNKVTVTKPAPVAEYFTLTPLTDAVYTGARIEAEVTSLKEGTGTITVHYYTDEAMENEVDPIDAGTYHVGVTTAEGVNYKAATQPLYVGSFDIARAEINKPSFANENETRTFGFVNKAPKTHDLVEGYDANAMQYTGEGLSVSGDTIYAWSAGDYNVSIVPDSNHVWTGGGTEAITGSYTIQPMRVETDCVEMPQKTYDGSAAFKGGFAVSAKEGALPFSATFYVSGSGTFDGKDAGEHTFTPGSDLTFTTTPETEAMVMPFYGCRMADLKIEVMMVWAACPSAL